MSIDFQNYFNEVCSKAKLVGANMVIVKDDKIIDTAAYGYASFDRDLKVTDDTIFRIASISKTIGAIGLMQLHEQGKLSIDDDISKYFGFTIRNPKYPDIPITVKMLTLQTSSITDGYPDDDPTRLGYNGVNGTNFDIDMKDMFLEGGKYYTPLTFSNSKPGENFIYSNFGCGLMACIIEIASGMRYIEYMEKYVFEPLGLDASFSARNIKNKDLIADLYYARDGYELARSKDGFVKNAYKDFEVGCGFRGPAGGLFISMKNLSKLMRLLINRGEVDGVRLLKESTVDLMYQIHWFGDEFEGDYKAKGIQMKVLHNYYEIALRGHTGGAYGVRSYMFFDQSSNAGACFITNGGFYKSNPDGLLDVFDATLTKFIEMTKVEASHTYTIDLDKCLGYVDNRTIIIPEIITKEGKTLIPAYSIADGLNTLPTFVDAKIQIVKHGLKALVDYETINDIKYVDLDKVLKELNLKYETKEKQITIQF